MRNKNRLVGSIVAGIGGLCCALVLVGRETPVRNSRSITPVSLLSGVPGDTRVVAASITGTLFGRDLQLAGARRKRNVAYGLPVRFKAGTMLDDEDDRQTTKSRQTKTRKSRPKKMEENRAMSMRNLSGVRSA